jgi:SAM-dependent methyltransferase
MTPDLRQNIVDDFGRKGSAYYDRNYGRPTPANYLRRLRRTTMTSLLAPWGASGRILDIGCGPAILFPEVLERCSEYYAVDLVPSNLAHLTASTADARIKPVCGDLDTLEWEPNTFDVIICSGAMEYTTNAGANLVKLTTWLRRGGFLICSFPNGASPYRLWSEYVYTPLSQTLHGLRGKASPEYKRFLFDARDVAGSLRRQNVDVNVVFFGHKLLPQPLDRLFGRLDCKLSEYLHGRPHSLMDRLCADFLISATKP